MKQYPFIVMLFCLIVTARTYAENEKNAVHQEEIAPNEVLNLAQTVEVQRLQTPEQAEWIRLTTKSGHTYELPNVANDANEKAIIDGLSDNDRLHFFQNREFMLKIFAGVLDRLHYPLGIWNGPVKSFFSRDKKESKDSSAKRPAISVVGRETVTKILGDLDRALWQNSPVLSRMNEIGAGPEVGIAGGAQFGRYGFYGITGTGITFSLDKENKVIVAEIYQDIEWNKRADPFYVGLGAFGTFLGSASYHDWNKPLKAEKGLSFCAMGAVGCISENNMRLGVSRELGVGFPGTVAMTSAIYRIPLIRVGLSPQFPGYIKAKTILGPTVMAATMAAPTFIARAASVTCQGLLQLIWGKKS